MVIYRRQTAMVLRDTAYRFVFSQVISHTAMEDIFVFYYGIWKEHSSPWTRIY